MMKRAKTPRWMLSISGVVIGVVLGVGLTSLALDTELDTGPRAFPYNGVLSLSGSVFEGEADLRFSVATDNAGCSFVEEHAGVAVTRGRFAVNIGSIAGDVPACVFDVAEVFLSVEVREAGSGGEYTALAGRHRVRPVAFSYWAAESSDMVVDNGASFGGDLTIVGSINADAVAVEDLTVDASASVSFARVNIGAQNNTAISTDGNAKLIFNENGGFSQGTEADVYAVFDGALTSEGGVSFDAGGDDTSFVGVSINRTVTAEERFYATRDNVLDASDNFSGAIALSRNSNKYVLLDRNSVQAGQSGAPSTLYVSQDGGVLAIHNDLETEGPLDFANGNSAIFTKTEGSISVEAGNVSTGQAIYTGDTSRAICTVTARNDGRGVDRCGVDVTNNCGNSCIGILIDNANNTRSISCEWTCLSW